VKQQSVLAVIPARFGSTRFPGKPLALINGKPMIQHVWERVQQVTAIDRTIVATDDHRIAETVNAFGGNVCMTKTDHPSGSDRVWEVAQQFADYPLIFNVQGDEPYLPPDYLTQAIAQMTESPMADIVTLVTPIANTPSGTALYHDPNIVKAVLNQQGQVFYFSRAPIPCYRDGLDTTASVLGYRHLGVYLYRRSALQRFTQLPPSPLEHAEKLEQLRGLEAGMIFFAATVAHAPIGVDTPEDLDRLLTTAF